MNQNDDDENKNNINSKRPTTTTTMTVVENTTNLLQKGIVQTTIPTNIINIRTWAEELSRVSPLIATSEDGEYAFYRNIMEEPDFPFDDVLLSPSSSIGSSIKRYFGVGDLKSELRLDDAFVVHYNTSQHDTTGAKHIDPSDITVNLCLEKSADAVGSMVMFYGEQKLVGLGQYNKDNNNGEGQSSEADNKIIESDYKKDDDEGSKTTFLVNQQEGYATIHWGHHPHETTALVAGRRTNVILTYCFTDKNRGSDLAMRSCYNMP